MITKSFFDLIKKPKESTIELEGQTDRLNWSVTSKCFMFTILMICAKVYWSSPIECYTPIATSGKDFEKFAKEYAFINEKFSKLLSQSSNTDKYNNHQNLSTQSTNILSIGTAYMWTPLYLSLAAILLYLPHLILSYSTKNSIDIDLQNSLIKARSLARKVGAVSEKSIGEIAESIKIMFNLNKQDKRKTEWIVYIKNTIHKICPICVPSRRNGTIITWTYLLVSFLYLIISVIIVIGMMQFAGYSNVTEYFEALKKFIFNDGYASDIPRFPKLAYVTMSIIDQSMVNHYELECVLPMYMLWGHTFYILSIWMMFVVLVNLFKLLSLLFNTRSRRESFIKKSLKMRSQGNLCDTDLVRRFCEEFLKLDGIMILKSMVSNCGQYTTSFIVWSLWNKFLEEEQSIPHLVFSSI